MDGQLTHKQLHSHPVSCISNDFDVREFEREEQEQAEDNWFGHDDDANDDDANDDALWVGCIPVLVNCNIKVKPRLCTQARQLLMMSNEVAFQLHDCRNKGRGTLETFVHVSNTFKISYNVV
jgi:hypothetical protein